MSLLTGLLHTKAPIIFSSLSPKKFKKKAAYYCPLWKLPKVEEA
jgi:hypothetical protein